MDRQLESNAVTHTGHGADLQATLDRVVTVKRAIKRAEKEHTGSRAARKGAGRVAAKAEQRAATAESRYDQNTATRTAGCGTAARAGTAAAGRAASTGRARTASARSADVADTRPSTEAMPGA